MKHKTTTPTATDSTNNDVLSVRPQHKSRSIESRAIYSAAIGGVIAFIASLVLFSGSVVPLFARLSIGTAAALLAAAIGIIVFFAAAYGARDSHIGSWMKRLRWFISTFALAFVHASICFLLYAGVFFIMNDSFKGLVFDSMTASLLVGVSVAISSYIIALVASRLTALGVSGVLAVFVLSGAVTSMVTADDPHWWERHFSALGAYSSGGVSSYTFNLTLIIAGLVIVSLVEYISSDFAKLRHKGRLSAALRRHTIGATLALVGVFLACVGIFPYDTQPLLHNVSAGGMAILFVGLVMLLPLLAPMLSRAFFVLSYGLMVALVVCWWLFVGPIQYLNLTAFEMIAAAIIFGWLIVFIRQIAAGVDDDVAGGAELTNSKD